MYQKTSLAQMNSINPPAPCPSYPFLHNCLACGLSFRSELALFDHNLTKEHIAIEKMEDNRRHQVSPPVHTPRDQTSSSSSSRRSGIKKRPKQRHHYKNNNSDTKHHNSDQRHTTLTTHTPFNHSTPGPSYQGSELNDSRAVQFHTHNGDPMSRKHSCSSVESFDSAASSNSSIPIVQYAIDDERRRHKKRRLSHREESRPTTPTFLPPLKHQYIGSQKPYRHNSFGGHFALPKFMGSDNPPVHACIEDDNNVNAIETSSVSSGDFSDVGCEGTHTKNEAAKNKSSTSSNRPYSPVSDDESNMAQTSTKFSLNDLRSETSPIHVSHQTRVHPVCTSTATVSSAEIHVRVPVYTATADSIIRDGTIAYTSATPIVRTKVMTDTSFTVNSPCSNFSAKHCGTEKPLTVNTAVVTGIADIANLNPAVTAMCPTASASKGNGKLSCVSKISKQKSPVRNKHSILPKKQKATNSPVKNIVPILNKTGKVKNLMSKVMENSLIVPLTNPNTPQIRLPDIPLIGAEHSFQPLSLFATEQITFQPKISNVESAKDHVLSQLVGDVMSSPSITSSLLPSETSPTLCSAATLSLLVPDVLKQLSGLNSSSMDGSPTRGRIKSLKGKLTDQSANEKSVSANRPVLCALDSPADIQPQIEQEESVGFRVKSEPPDFVSQTSPTQVSTSLLVTPQHIQLEQLQKFFFSVTVKSEPQDIILDHAHTTPPCTSSLPLSNAPPSHTMTTQSTVSQHSITTLSDSNTRPILFGDPQHSKNSPAIKLVDCGSRTDFTNKVSSSNKPKNRKHPRKNQQETHNKKSMCPTRDEQRSSSTGDSNNHTGQGGPKSGCHNDLSKSNDVGSKKKRQLKDGAKPPAAKKAKIHVDERSPTPGSSGGGDLSLLSSVEALNDQEKAIQEDLIALQKSKSEVSSLKIEQTETLEKLNGELQNLQHELATVMANVIVKEKALSDQNKAIESTKKREEDLAKKESRLAQSYKNVLRRKQDLFLPTTKQPNPKYKSNPDAVNNKPKSSANNVHRKSQSSSEKSHTTSRNGRKNSTTISNARSLDTVVSSSSDTSKTVVATSASVLSKIDRLVKSVSQVSRAKKVTANVKRKDLATKVTTTSTCISSDNSTIPGASSSKVAPTCLNDSVLCVDNSPVATVNNPESSVVTVDNSSNHSLTNTTQNNNESPSLDESSTPEQVSPNTDTPSAESLVVVDSQGGHADSVGAQIGSVVFAPHRQPILCLKVCGDYLFSGSSDHSLHVYKLTSGELVIRLPSYHERAINSIAVYEQEGTPYLITGSSDKMVHMYNVEKRKQVAQFSIGDQVTCVVVSGDLLVIAVVSGGVKFVDLSAKKEFLNRKQIHKSRISNMCVHQHLLITGSFDNLVSVWDIRQTLRGKDRNESGLKSVEALALPNTPLCVKIHGDHLFVGCGDGQLYIYSTQDWTLSRKLEHNAPLTCVDVMGGVLITGGFDKRIRCYDMKTFQLLQLYCFESRIFCVCAANSKIIAGLESGSLECVQLNLTTFYTCQWKNCELKFGALQHLTTYHLSDHVNSEEKLSTKCEWRDCTQVLNPSELLAHLKEHVRQQGQSTKSH